MEEANQWLMCNCVVDLRLASMDTGKPLVDAAFGEVLVTFEKLWWLIRYGEKYLKPDVRESGIMVGKKRCVLDMHTACS